MVKQYINVSISELAKHTSRYIQLVQGTDSTIYIIKNSKIVAKLQGVISKGNIS